jgi:hypothetical protein
MWALFWVRNGKVEAGQGIVEGRVAPRFAVRGESIECSPFMSGAVVETSVREAGAAHALLL